MQKTDFSRAIKEIKEAAKSIEKNAEKIVGGYKYQTDLYITIQLSLNMINDNVQYDCIWIYDVIR